MDAPQIVALEDGAGLPLPQCGRRLATRTAGLVVKAGLAANNERDLGEFAIPINAYQAHASASRRTVLRSHAIYEIRAIEESIPR
jgi:hypothetical protein